MNKHYLPGILIILCLAGCKSTQTASSKANPPQPTTQADMVDIIEITRPPERDSAQEPIFQVVEVMPMFPGGPDSLTTYFEKNLVYPEMEEQNGIEGTAYIQFVVEKDGSITSVRAYPGAESKSTEAMREEAVRLVKSMPNWNPGTQRGKAVRTQFMIPVRFRL